MTLSLKNEQKNTKLSLEVSCSNPLNESFIKKQKTQTSIKKNTKSLDSQKKIQGNDNLEFMQETMKSKFNNFIKKIIEFLASLISKILNILCFGLANRQKSKKKEKEIMKALKKLDKLQDK